MDPERALSDLAEISSQIRAAAIFDAQGVLVASTLPDEVSARRFAEAARALLARADEVRGGASAQPLVQLEAATAEGSVFIVRDEYRAVAAATRPEPTAGLVFYDLKSCLRALSAEEGDGRPRPRARSRSQAQTPPQGEPEEEVDGGGAA